MNRRASRILTVCAAVWLLVIWGHSCLPAAHCWSWCKICCRG